MLFSRKSLYAVAVLAGIAIAVLVTLQSSSRERNVLTIGVLQFTHINLPTLEGFKQAMRELEGQDGRAVHYVFAGPAPTVEELQPYCQQLLDRKVDLVFASTTPAARTAHLMAALHGTPVVFAPVNDPVSAGLLTNIQKPDGLITGVRLARSEGRRLQSLLEIVPSIRRVLIPYNPGDKSSLASLDQLQSAAPHLGVELVTKAFTHDMTAEDMPAYVPEGIDAIFLPREGLVMSRMKEFNRVAIERSIPVSTPRYRQVEQGALTGYGFMGLEIGRQAARIAFQILSGTPVAHLPVETARDYLFVNMETAQKSNITVPDAVLKRAHRIVRNTDDS